MGGRFIPTSRGCRRQVPATGSKSCSKLFSSMILVLRGDLCMEAWSVIRYFISFSTLNVSATNSLSGFLGHHALLKLWTIKLQGISKMHKIVFDNRDVTAPRNKITAGSFFSLARTHKVTVNPFSSPGELIIKTYGKKMLTLQVQAKV